jgi:TonB family protein
MKAHMTRLKDKEDKEADEEGAIEIGEYSTTKSSTNPALIYKEKAMYTQEALDGKISGIVRLFVTITNDGLVKDMLVIEELESGLSRNAINAARKIRCKPATRNGLPITVAAYLEFGFHYR